MPYGINLYNSAGGVNVSTNAPSHYVVIDKFNLIPNYPATTTFPATFRILQSIYDYQRPLTFINIPIGKSIFMYTPTMFNTGSLNEDTLVEWYQDLGVWYSRSNGSQTGNMQYVPTITDPSNGYPLLQMAQGLYSNASTISIVNCINTLDLALCNLTPPPTEYGFNIYSKTLASIVAGGIWSTPKIKNQRPSTGSSGTAIYTVTIYYQKGVNGATGVIPTLPIGGSYTFVNASGERLYEGDVGTFILPTLGKWGSPPDPDPVSSNKNPVYACDYTFTTTEVPNVPNTVTAGTWTNLRLVKQSGTAIKPSTYTITLWYLRNGAPTAPSGGTFNFSKEYNATRQDAFTSPFTNADDNANLWQKRVPLGAYSPGQIPLYTCEYTFTNNKGKLLLSNRAEVLNIVASTPASSIQVETTETAIPANCTKYTTVVVPSLTIDGVAAKPFVCLELLGLKGINYTTNAADCYCITRTTENTFRISRWKWTLNPDISRWNTSIYENDPSNPYGTIPFARFNHGS